jgi:transposase
MESLIAENAALKQELAWARIEIAELKRMIFGSKSERYVPTDPGQLQLPLGEIETVKQPEPEKQVIIRNKAARAKTEGLPVRSPIPAHIPRKTIEIIPEDIDLENAVKIGEVKTEYLDYLPSKIFVREIIRPKYKLVDQTIVIAELPCQPIPKSNVGAGLLAHILVNKYADHLPLYRQRKQFLREGVDIAESTINDWVHKSLDNLEPLYDLLIKGIKQSNYIQADETPMPVLSQDKPGSTHKGYFWAYYSPIEKVHCFDYNKSRGREGPDAFLSGFKGYLQSDGYAGYDHFQSKDITLTACMAHARRYFEHALDQDKERADYVLGQMRKLYAVERKAREQNMVADQRLELRQKESLPVIKELESWLKAQLSTMLPKSAIGKAIAYSLGLWDRLCQYTTNGILEIDNNLVENKIRPIALGRKNYLFAGSHEAAQRSAIIYSFFGTCQMHGVNPEEWLTDVLAKINDYNIQNLAELLPQNWKATKAAQD